MTGLAELDASQPARLGLPGGLDTVTSVPELGRLGYSVRFDSRLHWQRIEVDVARMVVIFGERGHLDWVLTVQAARRDVDRIRSSARADLIRRIRFDPDNPPRIPGPLRSTR